MCCCDSHRTVRCRLVAAGLKARIPRKKNHSSMFCRKKATAVGKRTCIVDTWAMEQSHMERRNLDIDIWERWCLLCSWQAWRGLLAWVLNTHYETPSRCHDLGLHVLEWSRLYSGGEWDAELNSIYSRSPGTKAVTISMRHVWRWGWIYLSARWSPMSYCSSMQEMVSGQQHWAANVARK